MFNQVVTAANCDVISDLILHFVFTYYTFVHVWLYILFYHSVLRIYYSIS